MKRRAQRKKGRFMEAKEGRHAAAGTVGVLITILGGCLWGFSGACGQYLFENKGVTAGWLVLSC